MGSSFKKNEQLLEELSQLRTEIGELKERELEHKYIHETLIQERKLYLDLANAQPAGIYRLRVFSKERAATEKWQSSEDVPYVIEFVSDRCCEILHVKKSVFESNPGIVIDIVHKDDLDEYARMNVEANLNLTPFLWEGRMVINEATHWVHFESLPRLMENGDVVWTGIFYDIDERKKAEQQITQKNEELQKINAEKDRFFSIIAHDLKSPLISVVGFSELLLEKVREYDEEGIKKYADIIFNSSHSAMDLLLNLMEWSLSQTGRMDFDPESFDMTEMIRETSDLFIDIASQKSIRIMKELPPEIYVYADKDMIGSVLRNLISNAIKFTMPNGTITVSVEDKLDEVMLKVSDSGVGISKSDIGKLFRIDENFSTIGTQNEKGTGLGLILCKEFVENNNGKIWVESELGKGSVFYVTIPNNGDLKAN